MLDRTDGPSFRSGFLSHARRDPAAPAVVVRGEVLTYGDMARDACRWAAAMVDACGGRPERVGILAYRSATAYTGTLAAMCAGAAYVPLNPTFPAERTAAMIAMADVDALIVDRTCLPQLASVLSADSRVAGSSPRRLRSWSNS